MNKFFNFLSYYILILLGLIGIFWMIWVRFIRERVIRDIPDSLLTEYRFWILIYICCIYLLVTKNLIKKTKFNIFSNSLAIFLGTLATYFWKPLMTLDHLIKYNVYNKDSYHHFMMNIIKYWDKLSTKKQQAIVISFQIIPRIILVGVLFLDTFYFNKLEIFYKVILIGILPFIFRYIEYSFNDFYDYLVKQLTDKYEDVHIFEKGYEYDISRIGKTKAMWHYELVSVEEYIEILFDTYCENIIENTLYTYVGDAHCNKEVYRKYEQKFNKPISACKYNDFEKMKQLFVDLIPKIIDLKITLYFLEKLKKEKLLIWSKICIFSIYFLCWSFILLISYYNYPIELPMFKYFISNFMKYLMLGDDLFINNFCSFNKNLITINSIKSLIINIINNIIK